MIHVCFSLHDSDGLYSKFAGTCILSMFENTTDKITVHILHDNILSADNINKFKILAEHYNQQIIFHNVEKDCINELNMIRSLFPSIDNEYNKKRFSIGALFRLLLPSIFKDMKKIIYLDSDIIVNLDIGELWRIELENDEPLGIVTALANRQTLSNINLDKTIPMCKDGYVKGEDYFNSGVLLMNLERLRNEYEIIHEGCRVVEKHPEYSTVDQEILNYCFASQTKKIPVKFNRLVYTLRMADIYEVDKQIYHYAGSPVGSGFSLDTKDIYNRLWLKYFMKTPWSVDENSLGRVDAELRKILRNIYIKQKKLARDVSMMMSGKTRTFYVSPENLERVKNTFELNSDENIILADNNSVQNLIESMKKFADKKVFFIMTDDDEQYKKIIANLIEAGFIENKNFINARLLMVDKQGTDFNSYQLLKLL